MATNNHTINIVNDNGHVYLDLNTLIMINSYYQNIFLGTIGLFGGLEITMAEQMTMSMVIILYLFYNAQDGF